MNLQCPVCNSKFTLDAAAKEEATRELIDLAAFFGKHWTLVNEYVDCFRVSQWASVGTKKRIRLLQDVRRLFEGRVYEYDGKRYRAELANVTAAIRAVADAEKFGFKNHNYLKKVLLNDAERVSAEGLTAKEERAREEKRPVRPPKRKEDGGEPISVGDWLRARGLETLSDSIDSGESKEK